MPNKSKIFKIIQLFLLACCLVILLSWQSVLASDTTSPLLKIFEAKTLNTVGQFLAFDKNFKGGGYVAVGNIAGKKDKEIIVGAGYGGSPQVRIFNKGGREIIPSFFPFAFDFKGGVQVATGDVNGDGKDEIITTPARDGQGWVKVYKLSTSGVHSRIRWVVVSNFLAYQKEFKGGVNLASCDINSDGKDEIITGPGIGGGPQVRIFDKNGRNLGLDFIAYEENFRGGVSVACGDVEGHKKPEIITAPQSERKAEIKVYSLQSRPKGETPEITPPSLPLYKGRLGGVKKSSALIEELKNTKTFLAFPKTFTGGVNLATGDTDSDGKKEILVAVAGGGGPQVKIFNAKGKLLTQFFAYDKDFRGGVRLAAINFDKVKNKNRKNRIEIITLPGAVYQKKCKKMCVALTFDDGYGAGGSFDSILNTLKARRVRATFFILGKAMQAYPDLMRRIINEGHQLANHGYSHGYFPTMTELQIRYELEITDQIAREITGKPTKPYFRYPYGAHNAATDTIVFNMGYKYYHWTASTGDTSPSRSAQNSLWSALYGLHDGSIILAHTQSPHTAAVLDQIITAIQNAGYQLVTIAEMP